MDSYLWKKISQILQFAGFMRSIFQKYLTKLSMLNIFETSDSRWSNIY